MEVAFTNDGEAWARTYINRCQWQLPGGCPKMLRASSRSYCRTTPAMQPARPTRSMEDSRPPDCGASRLKNGLHNGPPMGITVVRPSDHPARTGAFGPDAGCRNQILRSLQ